LQQIATAVFTNHIPPGITRNRMVATIAERLLEVLDQLGSSRLTEEYRSRSAVIDKDVQVMQGNETYMAHVIDIADDGSLLVRMHDGTERLLGSGEISLRTVT
jgi:BirA family biotin operon repressor/biotin-[acetyl-CoA-carboxylase] ligase